MIKKCLAVFHQKASTLKNPSEQIHSQLRSNPQEAFQLMYELYYEQLCRYAIKFVDSADEADDIIQSMFIQLWHKQEQMKRAVNIRAYLFQSARNASLNSLRSRRNENSLSELDIELMDLANDPEPVHEDRLESVKQVIETLPPQCKRIFELNRLEGYSYKEIAEELNISHRTVDTHLTSAMRTLRKKLNPVFVLCVLCLSLPMMTPLDVWGNFSEKNKTGQQVSESLPVESESKISE